MRTGDHVVAERGSTIVSGRVTEVGPRYIVVEHVIGSMSMFQGWRLTVIITPGELSGDEPAEVPQN